MKELLNTFLPLLVCAVLFCATTAGAAGSEPPQVREGSSAADNSEPPAIAVRSHRTSEPPAITVRSHTANVPLDARDYRITHPFAVKTNLLFDVVGGLNIGVEIPVTCWFSVSADFAYAYWRIDNRFGMQTLQGGIEAKIWFNPGSRPLTGWNLGVYGTCSSRYDIQWKGGWQGDGFISAGLVGGYTLPISRSLNLGFAVGGGVFYTPEARKYSRPQDGHLMWKETRQEVWRVFPAKLQVNLIWLIQSKKRVAAQ